MSGFRCISSHDWNQCRHGQPSWSSGMLVCTIRDNFVSINPATCHSSNHSKSIKWSCHQLDCHKCWFWLQDCTKHYHDCARRKSKHWKTVWSKSNPRVAIRIQCAICCELEWRMPATRSGYIQTGSVLCAKRSLWCLARAWHWNMRCRELFQG